MKTLNATLSFGLIPDGHRPGIWRTALIAIASSLLLGQPATAQEILTGPLTSPLNGHEYYLLTSDFWEPSELVAVGLGGHLVTIDDPGENDWVFEAFGFFGDESRTLWTGYYRLENGGPFVWVSGEVPGFENWFPGEPNNFTGGENYAAFVPPAQSPAGQWFDMFMSTTYLGGPIHGVVEVVRGSVLLGDVNLDGVVSLLDVSPFVSLITNGSFQAEGDVNQDGVVNLLDVGPFIQILTGG